MCSWLYSREQKNNCHIRLDVLTDKKSRACVLLSHSLLKFGDNISLYLCMFSSDVILSCFHLPWPPWAIWVWKKYSRICFLSLYWCPPSVCIGPVQGEADVISVLFLCSLLFTQFCVVIRCSALYRDISAISKHTRDLMLHLRYFMSDSQTQTFLPSQLRSQKQRGCSGASWHWVSQSM